MDHLYFVVHTHWDREWYQPFQQMRARLVAMADRMIPLVESGTIPSFHFDGQTIVLEDYLEVRPAMAARLRKLVRAGKIQIGPWYVLADSFLVSGESLIRNLELGMALARRFGRPLDTGYLPDQFGHIAQLPQILAGFGFRTAVLWRGVGADVTRSRFIWEAPDGSSVLTVYLPFGYSNGAHLPLESAESFVKRAGEIAERERPFSDGAPILVMNGTDHTEPDARLMTRIREARETSNITFEVGPLETFVNRLAAAGTDAVPRHRGELRSPLRAHLLPGVTSARTWIKQRDFENCRLLERFADPLAALARLNGRGDGLDAFLDLAWRTEIQNHPHDSICGCSVDQVHADMRYRFDQAAMIAENTVRRAAAELLERDAAGEPMLAVFNPTFAARTVVSGEAELEDPGAPHALIAADGRRIPLAIDVARPERAFEVELAAPEFKAMVAGLSQPTVLGRTVNRYELRRTGEGAFELDLFLSRAAISDLDLDAFRRTIGAELPDRGKIRIRATNAARCAVAFVAGDLAQAGFTRYRLVRDGSAASAPPDAAADSIANEFYRLRAIGRGVRIEDLRHGGTLELHFEDDGDRGDEYNFDPVPGSATVVEPAAASARVVEDGPVRRRLALHLEYALAAGLSPDRRARESRTETVAIDLTATLYTGLERIDFDARIDNRARDHRLRAALRTPIPATDALHDTSFGVVRRALRAAEPPGVEDIYPQVPHRTWTAVESAELSAALMSRGLYEVEVRPEPAGSTILLTLLRCVGWLSRSDLATRREGAGPELETPGAQELGEHRFEWGVSAFRGRYQDAGLIQLAAAYAFPPRLFGARDAAGAGAEFLVRCDNPRVAFSTARPGERSGRVRVRVYNASPDAERARFEFPGASRARPVDLAGRPAVHRALRRLRGGAIEVELRPFEIVTFDVRGRRRPSA
jgi:2-O-(6-phospho-alpha-D-mannosyl)-D-glycerate hydrolase